MKKEQVIILNGEEYRVGGPVLTIGLDDDCFPVVCSGSIVRWDEEANIMCDEDMEIPIRYTRENGSILDMSKEYWVSNASNFLKLNKECERWRREYLLALEKASASLA